jgi:nucleoside-diphosphate-sugar epimerase
MRDGSVLVTGAAGFMGRHLTLHLAEGGRGVRAIDVQSNVDFGHDRVRYSVRDIRDTDNLRVLLEGVEVVHHLASVHLDVHADEDVFDAVNVRAAEALVDACVGAGVRRLVHTSSVGIFGHVANPPAGEDAPKNPNHAYGRSKLAGERAVLKRAADVGLETVVLRPAWVYGPGCPRTAKLARAVRKGRFFYVGDGSNLRHPVYVDDMVEAYLRAENASSEVSGRTYIIAGPRAMPLHEMVATFAEVLGLGAPRLRVPRGLGWAMGRTAELAFGLIGRQPPFSRRSLTFFEDDNAFDTSAAERDLGFKAMVELREGLRRTLGMGEGVQTSA